MGIKDAKYSITAMMVIHIANSGLIRKISKIIKTSKRNHLRPIDFRININFWNIRLNQKYIVYNEKTVNKFKELYNKGFGEKEILEN
ncbi:MAG: hypothetical protein P8Y23_13150, partial [Candidatus Lokiarchaeota archaeon]